jgi:hypothetical protein
MHPQFTQRSRRNAAAYEYPVSLSQGKGKSKAKPSPAKTEQATPKKEFSYELLEEYGQMVHNKREAVEESWGKPKKSEPPKEMEAFTDVVAYKKNDELIRVWYRFGEVAGVMVPGVPNNDKVITAVINTLPGEDTWKNVTKASSASNIYDSKYNLYHATGSEIAAWVSRGANSMVPLEKAISSKTSTPLGPTCCTRKNSAASSTLA